MTPATLRPYQHDLIKNIQISLPKHKRIIAQLPTGGGKTVIFISIIKRAVQKGTTVLVLTESRKIFAQIIAQQHGRLIAAGSNNLTIMPGQVYIAMAQTLKRREWMIKQFAALGIKLLIVNDEGHVAVANPVIDALPDAYLISFTATPCAKASPWIPKMYNDVVCGPQVQELIELGFLSKYKHYERQIADLSQLELKGGEYTEESQEAVFDTRTVFDGMLDDLRSFSFKKCVVFTSSIKHCEHVYEQLQAAGFKCTCVHSQRPPETINEFTNGDAVICVCVAVLTKGWDFPPVDLICLDRAIGSLPLYLQICGRGGRILPGKKWFVVLDYGMNYTSHGAWSANRDWKTLAAPRKKKEKQEAQPMKTCPQCECIIPAAVRTCPFCGYEYPTPPDEPETPPESILIERTDSEPNPHELFETIRNKSINHLTPFELSIYARHTNKKKFATLLARYRDLNEPGFLKDFLVAMGYKPTYYYVLQKNELPERETEINFVIK